MFKYRSYEKFHQFLCVSDMDFGRVFIMTNVFVVGSGDAFTKSFNVRVGKVGFCAMREMLERAFSDKSEERVILGNGAEKDERKLHVVHWQNVVLCICFVTMILMVLLCRLYVWWF